MQLDQSLDLGFGPAHERHERKHLTGDAGEPLQLVMPVAQMRAFVGHHGAELRGRERFDSGAGDDHRRAAACHAIGRGLFMVEQHGAEGGLRAADEPGRFGMLQGLAAGGARVERGGQRHPGHNCRGDDDAEGGDGRASGGAVLVAQPDDAGADEVAETAAESAGVQRQRDRRVSRRRRRPGRRQVRDDAEQRRFGRPAGPAEQRRAGEANERREGHERQADRHFACSSPGSAVSRA